MDPVTHALSGALCVQCLPAETRSRWMTAWGALVAASPDIDVIFCRTPLQYIEWHRGFSHSIVGTMLLALLCALGLLWLLGREKPFADARAARHGWTLRQAWLFSWLLLLLHVWLDVMNSYGTMVLLPFSDYRVRFSGLFIIDLPLLLFMGAGLLFFARNRRVMIGVLAFVLLYPLGAVWMRHTLEQRMADRLPAVIDGHRVIGVDFTPEAFAPFCWKMIVDAGDVYLVPPEVITPFSDVPAHYELFRKPPQAEWQKLVGRNAYFRAYSRFAQFPFVESSETLERLPDSLSQLPAARGPYSLDTFADLRFGSNFAFVRAVQGTDHKETEKTFRISSITSPGGHVDAVRFRVVRGAGGDSGWMVVQKKD